jgi:hypothetical protein
MLQPQNVTMKYEHLFTQIDTGKMKIPKFQRDFVWTHDQTARLLDSMIKGYPIGTFILWKTSDQMRHFKNIGNADLPETPQGDAALYVLDGQQRITALYAVRKGATVPKDDRLVDYTRLAIDLSLDPDADEQVVIHEPPDEGTPTVTVRQVLTGAIADLAKDYPHHLDKIDTYRKRLTGYDFSTIIIEEYPIDVACEIFTRINTGGTQLTLFEIMVARTYDQERNFDLALEYDRLIDNGNAEKDLADVGYGTIPPSTALQCISAHLGGQLRRRDILRLEKRAFIDAWPVVKDGIFAAVDYLRSQLRIPVSRLLPYNALLVPLTCFFIRNGGKSPSGRQSKLLVQYFWWASLSQRFTSGVESKLAQDLERIVCILEGEPPDYKGEEVEITLQDLKETWFSTGNAFSMAIVCLYAFHQPKSFADGGLVALGNDCLKVASSKNYHHFFPKAVLKKAGFEDWQANSVLNITLVSSDLNKRKIKAKNPSRYMATFRKQNPDLDRSMKSHLIDDLDAFGIWADDYPTFLERRGKRVLREIRKRLHPKLT